MKNYWAGYSDGKIVLSSHDDGFGGFCVGSIRRTPELFMTKEAAKKQYGDVRKVRIIQVRE